MQPVPLCPVQQTMLRQATDGSAPSVGMSLLSAGGRDPLSQLELPGALEGRVTELTDCVLLLRPTASRYTELQIHLVFWGSLTCASPKPVTWAVAVMLSSQMFTWISPHRNRTLYSYTERKSQCFHANDSVFQSISLSFLCNPLRAFFQDVSYMLNTLLSNWSKRVSVL